jgi:hypothetical protein
MKRLAATLVLALGGLAATEAAAQSVRFEGFAIITGFTGTCADFNPTGEEFGVRYRPGGVTGNPANSGLSFFAPTGAYNYEPDGVFTTSFKAVEENGIFDYHGSQPDNRVRFISQKPATITPTTPFINVTGQIDNFDFMTGCRVRFIMSVTKRL